MLGDPPWKRNCSKKSMVRPLLVGEVQVRMVFPGAAAAGRPAEMSEMSLSGRFSWKSSLCFLGRRLAKGLLHHPRHARMPLEQCVLRKHREPITAVRVFPSMHAYTSNVITSRGGTHDRSQGQSVQMPVGGVVDWRSLAAAPPTCEWDTPAAVKSEELPQAPSAPLATMLRYGPPVRAPRFSQVWTVPAEVSPYISEKGIDGQYTCLLCNSKFGNLQLGWTTHEAGKKHRKKACKQPN